MASGTTNQQQNNKIQVDGRTVIFAVSLLILAVVGASFTTYLFFRQDERPAQAEQKKKEQLGPVTNIGAFTVNLADPGSAPRRFVRTEVALEVTNEQVLVEVSQRQVQVKDTIISVLSSKTMDDIRTVEGKEALRQELAQRINEFLNFGRVKNVYFTDFVFQ